MYYILNKRGQPLPIGDVLEWGKWFATTNRITARKRIGSVRVSTVFLGLDHSFGGGPPLLWETMIFGGPHGDCKWRYSSLKDALAGHKDAVLLASGEGQ